MRGVSQLIIAVCVAVVPSLAFAGPWRALPDAVARLRADSGDQSAKLVLAEAEASVLRESRRGRLAAVAVLMETYASLVVQLDDGEERLRRLESRAASVLLAWGDERRETDLRAAASAWTLAAKYDPVGDAIARLRQILLPPLDPEGGQTWRSMIDGAELVYQPPLQLRIGCSESDARCRDNEIYFRWVDLPGFWFEATEVTNSRYRLCVEASQCSPPSKREAFDDEGQGRHPVTGVRWAQARDFARWTGRRLPSEAEWERAARAKVVRSRFPWGRARRTEFANVWDETTVVGRGTTPAGTFSATGWGLYDIAGNVWEWCEDRYQTSFKEMPADGSPLRSGFGRVVRGGSWRRGIYLARVSARSWYEEYYSADDVGFRCAMGRSSEVRDARVYEMADRIFAVHVPPGSELVGVELSAEDRRYLQRRALTWLMLEARASEAVLQAATFLRRDPDDVVALDVLEWVEDRLVEEARAGNVKPVAELRARYLRAVAWNPRFERRLRLTNERVVEALRECGETMIRRGKRREARACFDAAVAIDPDDASLRRGREMIEVTAGETRIWPKDGKEMVWVPSGTFRFGASYDDRRLSVDELPAGPRTIQGFWLDRHEVTNAEYRRCVEAGACTPPGRTDSYDNAAHASHPVLWVSWFQARAYARWAGKRLPSEVEWERAARAGTETRFPWGDKWESRRANGFDGSTGDRTGSVAPVGSFPPSAWGHFDLIGNAAEWLQDVYHTSYNGGPLDGTPWEQESGPSSERRRVIRGGSYSDPPSRLRVSHRAARKPTEDHRTVGFRCAAD